MADFFVKKYAKAVIAGEMALYPDDNPNFLKVVPVRYRSLVQEYLDSMSDDE